ncbi:MAG: glycoside hydrolase family 9 protein [Phormidesmis sp.]
MHLQMGNRKIRLDAVTVGAGVLAVGLSCVGIGNFFAPRVRVNTQAVLASVDMFFEDAPKTSRVYAVSPQILAIEVPSPRVNLGQQQPYQAKPRDVLYEAGDRTHVERGGMVIGVLAGADKNILYTYDKVEEDRLNVAAADSPTSYLISSASDPNYAAAILPDAVYRKTKPSGFAETAPVTARQKSRGYRQWQWPAKHTIYLTLPEPMMPGQRYDLTFPGLGLTATDYEYQPDSDRSEAIQVSQTGFRPDDPFKVGYLSKWMGNGGGVDFPEALPFHLVDEQTKRPVYGGTALLVRPQQQSEDPRGQDYTLTEVHQLDFSEFGRPGNYRLCVQTIGCSFPFEISDSVWQDAFFTSIRGFYHQRSGIPIGPPFTSFVRQRAFHPDDGVKVYETSASLVDVDMGLGSKSAFEELLATRTNKTVPNAWGGYFDAGDWDRRAQHLSIPRGLLELHNLFPDYFRKVDLNLPESTNELPDILDEALWTVDFFRRLQTSDGGIRGGIESADHPNFGEASWQESLPVMAYAPDVWTSYKYAGVAARAAHTLKRYSAQLAATYEESALRAMAYAEANYPQYVAAGHTGSLQHYVKDERNLAALELYRLTGESRWHELFLATTIFTNANAEASVYGSHEQRNAAFLYARLNAPALGGALLTVAKGDKDNSLRRRRMSQGAGNNLADGADGLPKEAEQQGSEQQSSEQQGNKQQVDQQQTKQPLIEPQQANQQSHQQSNQQASQQGNERQMTQSTTDRQKREKQQNNALLAVDERIQSNARASFLRHADDLVALTRTTAFGWSKNHPEAPLGWGNGLGAPKGVDILQAHALTGDAKYLLAGINSTQFALGANPDNMTFTTGMGDRSPQNPLIIDQRVTGQNPPPGITLYGPADFRFYNDYWTLFEIADNTFPSPWEWPAVENYFDIYSYPIGAEFTVDYMLSSAYTWGYLAAR